MSDSIPSVVQAITLELSTLQEKREALAAEVEAIDAKLARIADQLGVKLPEGTALPRLPAPQHHRYVGSLPEAMIKALLEADKGYTRNELKAALRDGPSGDTVRKNENTYYNAVKRYLYGGKIVEIDGLLYHPDRAPTDSSQGASASLLPDNVTLFSNKKTATDQ